MTGEIHRTHGMVVMVVLFLSVRIGKMIWVGTGKSKMLGRK